MIRTPHADLILFAGGLLLGTVLTAAFAIGWTTANTQPQHHTETTP